MGLIYTPAGAQSLPHEYAKQFVNEGYDILVETGTYIEILFGQSEKILPTLLEKLTGKKILFWLDAHYSGGKTFETASPLL